MTIPTIIPVTALTGTNDPSYQVSKNNWNSGLLKIHASQASILGITSGAGDVAEIPLSGSATQYLDGTGAFSTPAGGGGGGGYTPTDYISGLAITKGTGQHDQHFGGRVLRPC
jgi:hypothetical protein